MFSARGDKKKMAGKFTDLQSSYYVNWFLFAGNRNVIILKSKSYH